MFKNIFIVFTVCLMIMSSANIVYSASDTTKPTFTSLSLDVTEAQPGDTVHVVVEADDLESGLSTNGRTYLYFYNEASTHYIYVPFNQEADYNVEAKRYEKDFQVPSNLVNGIYDVRWIHISDKAGNFTEVVYPSNASLTISGALTDTTKPTFTSLSLDVTEAQPGDTVHVVVEAEDLESGLSTNGRTYLYFFNEASTHYIYVPFNQEADYNVQTKRYEKDFQVPSNLVNGTYDVRWIHISDKVGNFTEVVYPSNASLKISGAMTDTTKPTFTSLSLDVSEAQPGDKIHVVVEAEDLESGLSTNGRTYLYFFNEASTHYIYVPFNQEADYNVETKRYEKDVQIPFSLVNGIYSARWIHITDKAGNFTEVMYPSDVSLKINPVFSNTDNATIAVNEPFDSRQNVTASSSFEGDLTPNIQIKGEVDSSNPGFYLLKYSAVGSTGYIYNDYRWITVQDQTPTQPNPSDPLFFKEPIHINVPATENVQLKSNEGVSTISAQTSVQTEGSYELSKGESNTLTKSLTNSSSNGLKFVIDKTSPKIEGVSNDEVVINHILSPKVSDPYLRSATLIKDGKSTSWKNNSVIKNPGNYQIQAVDKAGNTTVVNFEVKDTMKPVIMGATAKSIKKSTKFNALSGVKGSDNVDGDLTPKVTVSGVVNTNKSGTYTLVYKVADSSKNVTSIKRTITVTK